MIIVCNRCNNTGFLNLEQLDELDCGITSQNEPEKILHFLTTETGIKHDIQVCDCCGNGEFWYGVPGEHYNDEDPKGKDGPYAYNGGLCECH
jgi:hypothetical protein